MMWIVAYVGLLTAMLVIPGVIIGCPSSSTTLILFSRQMIQSPTSRPSTSFF
mgnify:CR=1 FL=1